MEYNVYCDESCHLENDKSDVMTIGAVYCPKGKSRQINDKIREIKIRNDIPPFRELKWIKVSPSKIKVYEELLDYFFENDDFPYCQIHLDRYKTLKQKGELARLEISRSSERDIDYFLELINQRAMVREKLKFSYAIYKDIKQALELSV